MNNTWRLPPIVGEVSDKQAIVLYELQNKNHQVYVLIDYDKYIINEYQAVGPTRVVLNFKHTGKYTLYWYVSGIMSYTHTINVNDITKLICVSCDLLEADTKHSLWNEIENEIPDFNVAILHMGDQAYQDSQYRESKKLQTRYEGKLKDKLKVVIYQLYARRYLSTILPHLNVLSNTSNYYIWDDHEITNDIVYDENDMTCQAATQVYRDYQMSFSITDTSIINDYCWFKYIGDVVVLAIERICGAVPLEAIYDTILMLDKIKVVKKLILNFTSAPIPPPHGKYGDAYTYLKGTSKFWTVLDLNRLLTWLFDWKTERDDRSIVILGGDVHFGLSGYYKSGNDIISVLISSPITNQPMPDRGLAARGLRGTTYISNTIDLVTLVSKSRRCYGVVYLDSLQTRIVFSQEKYPKHMYQYLRWVYKNN